MFVSPQISYVEPLIPNVMGFEVRLLRGNQIISAEPSYRNYDLLKKKVERERICLHHEKIEDSSRLQTRKQAFTRHQIRWRLDLGLPRIQTCER